MNVLVTGADGFVGEHLVARLLESGGRVIGAIRGPTPQRRLLTEEQHQAIEWRSFELLDPSSIRELVRAARPDAVVHLAGISSVAASWRAPAETFEANALGGLHLLEAVQGLEPSERRRFVLLVSSAEVYGREGTKAAPLREESELNPQNPYAASKAALEMIGRVYVGSESMRVVIARSFSHSGPGQRPPFVLPDWAVQLLKARAQGTRPVLSVGDLGITRDFLDVRDVVEAYLSLLNTPDAEGVYNVASGRGLTLADLLELLGDAAGMRVQSQEDPTRLRRADIRSLVGDPSRLTEATGWRPRISPERMLCDLCEELERSGVREFVPA